MISPCYKRLLLGCLLASVMAGAARAQLPVARLAALFPPGGQAGTQVEVTVTGQDLDELARLDFSHSGIRSAPTSEANKFTVTIASNVPPGVYEARAIGVFGCSNPRAFVVGDGPEVVAPAGRHTAAAMAASLAPGSVVSGQATANAADYFKFTAKKGQRFLLECQARAIDSRMEVVLALSAAAGRELDRNRRGGLIDFTAPADGEFLVKAHDVLFRGGADYFYRLALHTRPQIDFIFPPAGLPGTKTSYTLYGRNLPGGQSAKGQSIDGGTLEQLTVEIALPAGERPSRRLDTGLLVRPAEAVVDGFDYRLATTNGLSNPVLLTFATAPVVLEQEPNDRPAQAQKITPPCEVAGQFFPANEQDWFTFDAKKGDVFWIEVFSHRLGLPTDPFLLLQRVTKNDQGGEQSSDLLELYDTDTNIGDREFNTTTRDPAARFEAKDDGAFRLQVRDLFNRTQSSPRHVYRLSIRKESPDFRLVALTVAPKLKADAKNVDIGVPLLRRGETTAIRVMAFRRDNFGGDIELSVEDPPPGLLGGAGRIEAGKNSGLLFLTGSDNAAAWSGPLTIIGRGQVGGAELVREARGASQLFTVANTDTERPESRLTREFVFAFSDKESPPVAIAAENRTFAAPPKGKLTIPIKIVRRGDATATMKIKAVGPAALEALKELDVDGKATNATFELDFDKTKLPPGAHTFAFQGQATGKYRPNPGAVTAAEAAAKEAGQRADDLAAAAKKAAAEAKRTEKETAESAARVAAEKLLAEAGTQAKEAEAKKTDTAKRAKDLAEKYKSRDATFMVYSAPITLQVAPPAQAKSK